MNGTFITFEGTEGTGKSTQIRFLADSLRQEGWPVVVTREPGGTKLGEDLRAALLGWRHRELSALAELFLYLADRAQHQAEVVGPALGRGEVVLCDRSADATIAYQGYGRGLDLDFIRQANGRAQNGRQPDLTILLDLKDVDRGLRRSQDRHRCEGTAGEEDRFEAEAPEFHERVRRGYLDLAAAEPERIRVLPADLSEADLHRKVVETVRSLLPERSA